MASACGVCELPVHDHAVICPHCGKPTGIAPDHTIDHASLAAMVAERTAEHARMKTPMLYNAFEDPGLLLIGGIASTVAAVVDTVLDHRAAKVPPIPIATARARTKPAQSEPDRPPGEPPEQIEPTTDKPRFLK